MKQASCSSTGHHGEGKSQKSDVAITSVGTVLLKIPCRQIAAAARHQANVSGAISQMFALSPAVISLY
jgi:hypothetical protein